MSRPVRKDLPRQLLAAASEEFAEHGYHQVRIDSIAERCGVTKGAVYMHFRSKLAMFLGAYDVLAQEHQQTISAAAPSATRKKRSRDELRARLLAELSFHGEHPALRRMQQILDSELAREPAASGRDGLRASFRALRKDIRKLVQTAARAGEIGPGDPAGIAFHLVAQLEGTLAQIRATPEDAATLMADDDIVAGWLAALPRASRRRGFAQRPSPNSDPEGEDFRPAF